jgi:hypothetical protein
MTLFVLMTAAAGLRAEPEVTGVSGECAHACDPDRGQRKDA